MGGINEDTVVKSERLELQVDARVVNKRGKFLVENKSSGLSDLLIHFKLNIIYSEFIEKEESIKGRSLNIEERTDLGRSSTESLDI